MYCISSLPCKIRDAAVYFTAMYMLVLSEASFGDYRKYVNSLINQTVSLIIQQTSQLNPNNVDLFTLQDFFKNYSLSIGVNDQYRFFSLLTHNSTNQNHAASWNHGNIALFAFIFPGEINVYAAIIWPGSCDSDYCVCFSRHHGRGLIISFVIGVLEMLSSSAVCWFKVFLF